MIRWSGGEASLNVEVYGLDGRRLDLFTDITPFIEGLAAEKMYCHATLFLGGDAEPASKKFIQARVKLWQTEGFRMRWVLNDWD